MSRKSNEIQEPEGSVATEEIQQTLPATSGEVIPSNFYTELLSSFQRVMDGQTKAQAEQARAQADFFLKAIAEIRKPVHDPIREAQDARARETQKQGQKAYWAQLEHRADACTHLREDMTSAIAWATQSDSYADYPELCKELGINGQAAVANLVRGHCQHCQTKFSPIREECLNERVWKRYGDIRRVPTQRGSGVLYVNS